MRSFTLLSLALMASSIVYAEEGGACEMDGQQGICMPTAECMSGGGSYQDDFCPDDHEDIKCCVGCSKSGEAKDGGMTETAGGDSTSSGSTEEASTDDSTTSSGSTGEASTNDSTTSSGSTEEASTNDSTTSGNTEQASTDDSTSSSGTGEESTSSSVGGGTCEMDGQQGICMPTAECTSGGGSYQDDFCPDDPEDIKCCVGCTKSGEAKDGGNSGEAKDGGNPGEAKDGGNSGNNNNNNSGNGGFIPPSTGTYGGTRPPNNDGESGGKAGGAGGAGRSCHFINDATVDAIKEYEGLARKDLDDGFGYPTAGYGHLCKQPRCREVKKLGFSFPLTEQAASKLLLHDIRQESVTCLKKCLSNKARLNEYQYGALASLIFNVGCGGFERSSVQKRINAGEDASKVIADRFPSFNKVKDATGQRRTVDGLTIRRNKEIKFAKKKGIQVYPCK